MAAKTPADADDGNTTDEVHKRRDPAQPFHRIGQRVAGSSERRPPSFHLNAANAPKADGQGFARGVGFESCRRPAAVQNQALLAGKPIGALTAELARTIPAWILVTPNATPNAGFQEVEGTLIRSFQTWTDFPVAQFHEWYDWNFHVEPTRGYGHLAGANAAAVSAKTPLVKSAGATLECEWDTGAFGKIQNLEGPMFRADWCWPMTGDFVWVAGRWIYDCGHDDQGKVRTELHPCAAVATARWEAVQFTPDKHEQIWPQIDGLVTQFPTTTPFVPGIRFMFFASRLGGYKQFSSLGNPNSAADKNYRFIVDVPRIGGENRTVVVGATPDFPASTVSALNPRLLVSFSFDAFSSTCAGRFQQIDPIVTVIDRGGGNLPDQVIIEIPIDKLAPNTDAYGVVVSLGWHDSANTLAKRVVKCTVDLDRVELIGTHILGSGLPWVMKIGVNGRWIRKEFPSLGPSVRSLRGQFPFPSFFVPLDHPTPAGADIKLSAHGKIVRRVGEFIKRRAADRTAKLSGTALDYDADFVRGSDLRAADIAAEFALLQISTLKEQNEAIGVIDVKEGAVAALSAGGAKSFVEKGLTLEEVGTLAELVFVNDRPGQEAEDYRLSFTIRTQLQQIP